MTNYLLILIGTVLVNNIVMVKIFGLCPFMGGSKKLESAASKGATATFVLTLTSGASYLFRHSGLMKQLAIIRLGCQKTTTKSLVIRRNDEFLEAH